jgi:NDP-sugar pyrophosphorylase family protein
MKKSQTMKIIILAGGLGTRLQPYTFVIPKPLLPFGNKTLLDNLIEHVKQFNPEEIILSLGYQAELIRAYFNHNTKHNIPISFIEEDRPLGTAGSLLLAETQLDDENPFFLMNGDIITKLDLEKMKQFHSDHKASITVAMVKHKYKSPFGVLEIKDNRLVDIIEKPEYVWPVSSGIYCINKDVLKEIPKDCYYTMPELMLANNKNGGKVCIYEISEYWRAIETKDNFEDALREMDVDL